MEKEKLREKNAALIQKLESLEINIDDALARFADDQEAYIHILGSFVVHAPSFVESAKAFQNKDISQNLESYKLTVHSIKGSVRSIGAEKLGDMAEELETAAKKGDAAFIKANNDSLVETLEKFIEALSACLAT
jgi:HPt (histidine-containing phosphotransfer) domain-containing protein